MKKMLRMTAYALTVLFLGSQLIGCNSNDDSVSSETSADDTEVDDTEDDDTEDDDNDGEIVVSRLADFADGYVVGAALPAGDASNSIHDRDDLQEIVIQHFSQVTAENIMKPEFLQPSEGSFFYDYADDFVDFAEGNSISVHGHTLVWHKRIADFMENCSGSDVCSGYLTNHITNVVERYKGRVSSWDVVNEAFTDDFGTDSTYRNIDTSATNGVYGSVWYREIGKDYIPLAFTTAHAADPDAELYYNDYNLEDNNTKLTAVLTMVNELITDDVPIDGIGFQMHISLTSPAIEDIKAALTLATATGLKIKITELDIVTNEEGAYDAYTSEVETLLNDRYAEVVSTYLDVVPKAQIGGISMWGVSDADSWIPDYYGNDDWPLLFDADLNPKQALSGVAAAMSEGS